MKTACMLLIGGAALLAAVPEFAPIHLPPYSRDVLPNGVVVEVMVRKGIPLVDIDVEIKGGDESDPDGQSGLAEITGDLIRKGTGARSADEFSRTLDSLGGTFRVETDPQGTLVESEFLSKDLAAGLALVSDAVLHPTFPEAEVSKLLAQRRDSIKAVKDFPARAINYYAHAYFFGPSHPYGRVADEKSIDGITRSRIATYHQSLYTGRNLVIAVVGDVDPEMVKAGVEKAFGGAPAGTAYTWHAPVTLARSRQPRLLLVNKPGATQTYFYIAQPGIDAHNPDRTAIELVNTLYGGRFTSMLNEELRVKTGLTYGAQNRIDEDRLQGWNTIETYTKTDSTGKAIDLALKTLKRFHDEGITAEQLDSAKVYIMGTKPRQLETINQLASELLRLEALSQSRDEVDQLFARIQAVTLTQANQAAKTYFEPQSLTFVLAGDAGKIREAVKKLAPRMEEVEISSPGFGPGAAN